MMALMSIAVKWFYDNVPEASKEYYQKRYLKTYRRCADIMNNGVLDQLNERFKAEVGVMDDYNNPTYNNWMAAHMTEELAKRYHDRFWTSVYYNADLVLVCVRHGAEHKGRIIRMEFVPGTEEFL